MGVRDLRQGRDLGHRAAARPHRARPDHRAIAEAPAEAAREEHPLQAVHEPVLRRSGPLQGALHPGAHEPLIEPALFDQVQSLLKARNAKMTRHITHAHHLKGLLHCGSCGSRMLLDFATNPRGTTYAYFICSGRAASKTTCTRRAVPVPRC